MVVHSILVDRLEGAELFNVDRGEVRSLVESMLPKHHFVLKPDAKGTGQLRVRLGAGKLGEMSVSLRYEKEEADSRDLESLQTMAYDGSSAAKDKFKNALENGLDKLLVQVREEGKKTSALQTVRDYAAGRPVPEAAMNAALETLMLRRDKSALVPLTEGLKQSNVRVSLKIVQTLSVLGDEQSVEAITIFAERKVPEVRRHAIEAVKKIGGRKAAAWLFAMSTGHSDLQVREAAKLALRDVEGRLPQVN